MEQKKPEKKLTVKEAKIKVTDYCAYQERSQQQVRDKLYEYGLHQNEVEDLISQLITEGFINEERFAKSYAGGKFRIKKWGRLKIINGLKFHKISDYCIRSGLKEINDEEYKSALLSIINKKQAAVHDKNPFLLKQKVANYAIQKGYEAELVWNILNDE